MNPRRRMRRRLLFVTPSSDNLWDHRDRPHDDQAQSSTPVILCGAFCRAASRDTMRFTFSVLISTTSLYKHKEPPNPLKQGRFAALRSPKILSCLKMCTLPERRKSPALRGFVGGRCALVGTALYHSAIFERAPPDENAAKTPPNAAHSPAGVSTPHPSP